MWLRQAKSYLDASASMAETMAQVDRLVRRVFFVGIEATAIAPD